MAKTNLNILKRTNIFRNIAVAQTLRCYTDARRFTVKLLQLIQHWRNSRPRFRYRKSSNDETKKYDLCRLFAFALSHNALRGITYCLRCAARHHLNTHFFWVWPMYGPITCVLTNENVKKCCPYALIPHSDQIPNLNNRFLSI